MANAPPLARSACCGKQSRAGSALAPSRLMEKQPERPYCGEDDTTKADQETDEAAVRPAPLRMLPQREHREKERNPGRPLPGGKGNDRAADQRPVAQPQIHGGLIGELIGVHSGGVGKSRRFLGGQRLRLKKLR